MLKLNRVALAALLLAPLAAGAQTFEFAATAGVGHTDNILRTPGAEIDETIAQAGLQLYGRHRTSRLSVDLLADLAYEEYLDNTYDGDVVGNLTASGVMQLIPERLEWSFEDNFGQTRRDVLAVETPENRENINYLSTGPDLLLRIAQSNELRLGARYSRVDYETMALDNERYAGTASLAHEFSGASSLGANVLVERVRFKENSEFADFDRRGAFLSYQLRAGRTEATLDAGVNETERQNTTDSGMLLRFLLTRSIGQRSNVTFTLGQELADAAGSFRAGQGFGGNGQQTASLNQSGEPFTSRYATLGWDISGRITRLGFAAAYYDESYENTTSLDRTRTQGSVYVERSFGGSWLGRLTGRLEKYDYDVTNLEYRESALIAAISRSFGRKLHVDLSAERYDRQSNLTVTEFGENRFWLKLRYGQVSRGFSSTLNSDAPRD